jgi:cholest-4-en-3-one 26-monooxygenase
MTVTIEGIDLLDLDRFARGEHHEMFRRLRADDPVYWHPDPDGGGFWNLTRHADVVMANRGYQHFSSARAGTMLWDYRSEGDFSQSLMLNQDPPNHTRYRFLVNRGFTPRSIAALEAHLQLRARLIVDAVIERGSCDLVNDLTAELPLQAIAEMIGVPQADRSQLFDWTNRMIGADDPEFAADNPDEVMAASVELFAYVDGLAAQRAVEPQDDILTNLVTAEVEGDKLSQLEVDAFMLLLSVAGNETTRNTTVHGIHALLSNPDQLALLKSDFEGYLPTAMEEMLRWASPVLYFRRTAMHDTEIGGKAIKEGDRVLLWYISANRDEAEFDDPYTFDITRHPNRHVAFGGGGPHFCLGANLARLEMRLIFTEILTRLDDLQLAGDPVPLRSNFVGGVKHLPVTWTPGKRVYPEGTTIEDLERA